ncbi:peptidase, M48 family [Deferribacter desulfuricans SSM1]|uniref:Protease HtpX homolog n=1 Tax=Deferribacter desulfuricans (strain DSM 14783 / JCM 11476 / NBRC 101012 / SSM1) TaxID=639282 RepID=D3P9Q6_DEFDS|nr:zinc metalloprotease HtpX [Deferribacter desulfuricans]BAI81446.1 peptidase, M48 family [Deferribacter desulfuricans SSM1]
MNLNTIKTALLLGLLTVLFIFIGGLLGGRTGMMIAFIFALGMNFFSYWFSDKIVLSLYRAKQVTESEAPRLYAIVRRLTQKAGLPMPKIYIIQSPTPNAFATGRNPSHAAVAVTTGILELLDEDELEGVIGHELAHIYGRDILISTIAASIAGAVMMLADWARWAFIFGGFRSDDDDNPVGAFAALIAMIIAPIAALLIQMAVSRSREYLADERGAKLTGKPLALANALRKIAYGVQAAPMDANPATAHMFIMNPLSGRNILNLFSTHPPVEERIKRLEQMAYAR